MGKRNGPVVAFIRRQFKLIGSCVIWRNILSRAVVHVVRLHQRTEGILCLNTVSEILRNRFQSFGGTIIADGAAAFVLVLILTVQLKLDTCWTEVVLVVLVLPHLLDRQSTFLGVIELREGVVLRDLLDRCLRIGCGCISVVGCLGKLEIISRAVQLFQRIYRNIRLCRNSTGVFLNLNHTRDGVALKVQCLNFRRSTSLFCGFCHFLGQSTEYSRQGAIHFR